MPEQGSGLVAHKYMGKPYNSELGHLEGTLQWAANADLTQLRAAVASAAGLPMLVIGSGGSLTAAHLLASAQRRFAGRVATVTTPLEACAVRSDRETSVWLLSAGGSNVDILDAFSASLQSAPRQLVVMCGRRRSRLNATAEAHRANVEYVDAEGPVRKDGFLATNTLLAFASLISRAYTEVYGQPAIDLLRLTQLATGRDPRWSAVSATADVLCRRETVVVLYSGTTACGAIDLESKFTEAALGHTQLADYRNFAHGRHHWLAKRGSSTGVVAFTSDEDRNVATKTLALLPKSTPILTLDCGGPFFNAALTSVICSLMLVGIAGRVRGIDPGRPGVPEFGRRLYRLRVRPSRLSKDSPSLPGQDIAAIERKSGVLLGALERRGDLNNWLDALTDFKKKLQTSEYFAAVLDYDGTLVDTKDRQHPPRGHIIREMSRLLRGGFVIGVATGRGHSVRRDLCSCIPKELRSRVIIGYYNGAVVSPLTDDTVPDGIPLPSDELRAVGAALRAHSELAVIAIQTDRPFQITLSPRLATQGNRLWEIAHLVTRDLGTCGITVVQSSHSVDILAPLVSKMTVLDKVASFQPIPGDGNVLCIGDKGRWPGNDFVLLRSPHSLSVDESSVDPETCWNLSPPGVSGSEATLLHLRSLRRRRGSKTWRYVFEETLS